jgi:DNA primase
VIPEGFIQDLLSRVDIVDVVGRHVDLKKAGINHKGLCPFHGEKSPSFIVSPSRQTYHCFGCGVHGDAIRFLTEQGGLAFPDAVRELAQQVGLKVPEDDSDPAEREKAAQARARQATLSEVLEKAASHYKTHLKASPRAIDYLKRRGLTGPVAARFGLGYAPEGWRSLAGCFAHYDDPLLVEAGLVIVQGEEGQDQKRYDRFRDRVMFPIRSVKGEVIGFGGRVLDQGEPKYLNSPETPVFSKGRELYGLFEARQALRDKGYVLVVEGYMDVVALAQSGLANAVATLGTACTADHVHKLFRHTDSVVFSFDGDKAGRRAAGRALEAALPHATDLRTVRFLFLPPEHDPDSFVRDRGVAAFEQCVADSVPLSRQLIDNAAEDLDLATAEGRAKMLALARPLWNQLPAGALRDQVLAGLAERARADLEDLAVRWGARAAAASRRRSAGIVAAPGRRGGTRPVPTKAWDRAARILLQQCELWQQLSPPTQQILLHLPGWQAELFAWLDRQLTEHGPLPWPGLRDALAAETWGEQARVLVDDALVLPDPSLDALHEAVTQGEAAQRSNEAAAVLGRL